MRIVILELAVLLGETGLCAIQMLVEASRRRNTRVLLNFTPPSTQKNFKSYVLSNKIPDWGIMGKICLAKTFEE